MSKMGSGEQALTETHNLKAGYRKRQCEQDRVGGTGTDSNSHSESRAGNKVM